MTLTIDEIKDRQRPVSLLLAAAQQTVGGNIGVGIRRTFNSMEFNNISANVAIVQLVYNGTVIKTLVIPPTGVPAAPPAAGNQGPVILGGHIEDAVAIVTGVDAANKGLDIIAPVQNIVYFNATLYDEP